MLLAQRFFPRDIAAQAIFVDDVPPPEHV